MVDTAVEAMEEAGTAEEATVAVAAMVTETAGAMEVAATEVMAVAVDTVEEDIVAVEVVVTGATVVDTASMEGILEGAGAVDGNCTVPNDCAEVSGMPYCIDGVCRACDPTRRLSMCDCDPDSYCVSFPDDVEYGTCRAYEAEIFGRNCDRGMQRAGLDTVQGVNDTVFCGKVVYAEDMTAQWLEWEGSCQASVCRVCSIGPIPALPFSDCNDGRGCKGGKYVLAPVGIFNLVYTDENPMFAVFYYFNLEIYVLMATSGIGLVSFLFYYRKLLLAEDRLPFHAASR